MFDLRYHVASLTAVFVALVIGILVGVGLSGRGFVDDAERTNLNSQIADLRSERDSARGALDEAAKGAQALRGFSDATYSAIVPGRLEGKRVAVLFIGPVDRSVSFAIDRAVRDAGGTVVRTRSIEVPLDVASLEGGLRRQVSFRSLLGVDRLSDLGAALAAEFAAGGGTPLWDALGQVIVQERAGPSAPPADALVVVRTADPQVGATKRFLQGLYAGLARSGSPAVGTERPGDSPTALPAFAKAGLSTVDSIDTSAGRLGLVLLLQGAQPGTYGVRATARDGLIPVIPPLDSRP